MSRLLPKPDPFKRGATQLSPTALRQIIDAIPRQITGGDGVQVGIFSDRLSVSAKNTNPQLPNIDNYIAQFVVSQIQADLLVCVPFTPPNDGVKLVPQPYDPGLAGKLSGTVLSIVKPYQLQQTPWNGKTVTLNNTPVTLNYIGVGRRTAQNGFNVETQVIVPDYCLGDIIMAVRANTGYLDPNTQVPIAWMDMNTAARAWAASS